MSLSRSIRWWATQLRNRIYNRWFCKPDRDARTAERRWELDVGQTTVYQRAMARECSEWDLVDDRTWSDLEMEKIFARFDRSLTPLGTQYLYALLRTYRDSGKPLKENVTTCRQFQKNPGAAQALRAALKGLNHKSSADVADFVFGPAPEIPSRHRLFYLLSAVSILCTLGLFASWLFLFPLLSCWLLNVILHSVFSRSICRHAPGLASVAALLQCVAEISRTLGGSKWPEARELEAFTEVAGQLQKKVSRTFLRQEGGNDLVVVLTEYLNLLCLFELSASCRAIEAVNKQRAALREIFRIIARLDAFHGLSNALAEYPLLCVPEFQESRAFAFDDVYHPLVHDAVRNTIHSGGNSILVSGTNMAGKTTFMKTLGVNVLLAQTVGLYLAGRATLPRVRVKTLIERVDAVTAGQSYFFFEATELLRLLKDAERTECEFWFVIDEIFRGTNTVERVAAGTAVLRHLTGGSFVIASTHDHELADLLRGEFDFYHFSEVVGQGEARFDYTLRNGPCKSRNAIKLLALAGYPTTVTEFAEKLANRTSNIPVRPITA